MFQKNSPLRFAVKFLLIFAILYFFNIYYFAVTNPGKHYNAFLAFHLNYIQWLRWLLLWSTAQLLKLFGFRAIFNDNNLLVAGHGVIQVVYTCLGLGVLSFYVAFVITFPKPVRSKIIALLLGIICIEFLNILRFMLLALYGNNREIDHHTIFNVLIYVIIIVGLYFWIKKDLLRKTGETN